jgi:oligopeptide transport system ATP-binding protein
MTPLLQVTDLKKHFPARKGSVKAVDGVSFELCEGETLGIVGESGSGKSTLARLILRLIDATAGSVRYEGQEVLRLSESHMRPLRKQMQIVFQSPLASLPPHMTVGTAITEPLRIHGVGNARERLEEAKRLLDLVGVGAHAADAFPHEFSGGQQQRVGIARALALGPKLLILDEPVSALDVSIQAQVLNLLEDLQKERGLTYLFIAHNLAVVEHISTRVGVMYLGQLVELGPTARVYESPAHPYTKALLAAVPRISDRTADLGGLTGEIPSPLDPPPGCRFHTRCPYVMEICKHQVPAVKEIDPGHQAACHLL